MLLLTIAWQKWHGAFYPAQRASLAGQQLPGKNKLPVKMNS
jgi:hypothetical protein